MMQLFSEKNKIEEIFRSYFGGVVDGLKEHNDPILNAIRKFKKHPSIPKVKQLNFGCKFSFENVSLENVKKSNSRAGYYDNFTAPRYSN